MLGPPYPPPPPPQETTIPARRADATNPIRVFRTFIMSISFRSVRGAAGIAGLFAGGSARRAARIVERNHSPPRNPRQATAMCKQKLGGIIPLRKRRRAYVLLQERRARRKQCIRDCLCSGAREQPIDGAPQAQFGGSPIGCAASANFATVRIIGSENLGPTICSPTGSRAAVSPAVTLAAGSASSYTMNLWPIQSR